MLPRQRPRMGDQRDGVGYRQEGLSHRPEPPRSQGRHHRGGFQSGAHLPHSVPGWRIPNRSEQGNGLAKSKEFLLCDAPYFYASHHRLSNDMPADVTAWCHRYYEKILMLAISPMSTVSRKLAVELLCSVQVHRCLNDPESQHIVSNKAVLNSNCAGTKRQLFEFPHFQTYGKGSGAPPASTAVTALSAKWGIGAMAAASLAVDRAQGAVGVLSGSRAERDVIARSSPSFLALAKVGLEVAQQFLEAAPKTLEEFVAGIYEPGQEGVDAAPVGGFKVELFSSVKYECGNKRGEIDWLLYAPEHNLVLAMLEVKRNPADVISAADQVAKLHEVLTEDKSDGGSSSPRVGFFCQTSTGRSINRRSLEAFVYKPFFVFHIATAENTESLGGLPVPSKMLHLVVRQLRPILSQFIIETPALNEVATKSGSAFQNRTDDLPGDGATDAFVEAGVAILEAMKGKDAALIAFLDRLPQQPWFAPLHKVLVDTFQREFTDKGRGVLPPKALTELLAEQHASIVWFTSS